MKTIPTKNEAAGNIIKDVAPIAIGYWIGPEVIALAGMFMVFMFKVMCGWFLVPLIMGAMYLLPAGLALALVGIHAMGWILFGLLALVGVAVWLKLDPLTHWWWDATKDMWGHVKELKAALKAEKLHKQARVEVVTPKGETILVPYKPKRAWFRFPRFPQV